MMNKPDETTRTTTQIVCTLGPASKSAERIGQLLEAGMEVARLHFSYGSHEEHETHIRRLREAMENQGHSCLVLQDLCGTKVRMQTFEEDSVLLENGGTFVLTGEKVSGNARRAGINLPELISAVEKGDLVLLNDAALRLKVTRATESEIHCRVEQGGRIKAQQAVHVPGKSAPVSVPTDKDREDVLFGIGQGVDWIAQSYARRAEEIRALRDLVKDHCKDDDRDRIRVMAKIERREALDNLEAIIDVSDGIMVARGDLALEIPMEEIGVVQKDIIHRAKRADKYVITATEMLSSMIESTLPTRAEVTDITNAILDGTDAVMLSGESAVGKHPVEATRMMARVIKATEQARAAGKV